MEFGRRGSDTQRRFRDANSPTQFSAHTDSHIRAESARNSVGNGERALYRHRSPSAEETGSGFPRFPVIVLSLIYERVVMRSKLLSLLALVALTVSASVSWAATTATQNYTVTVPQNISITAPSDVSLTHDMTDANQAFPSQQWVVKGNTQNGVTVSFATTQPFVNASNSNAKRDAGLSLSVGGTAGTGTWTVTKASDTSNYAGGSATATVQAASNGSGRATFNLGVTFITNGIDTVEAGNYVTTVTGTVTAN